jgi:aspartate/methionine/tyrosine aminotransferase
MQKRLSDRLEAFDSSIFRDVVHKQRSLIDPIDLSIGIPEDLTPLHIKAAGISAITNDKTEYTPANGIPELREEIRKKLHRENNIEVEINQITVVPGLTTGQLLIYMAILDPGDEIIVMDPGYPPYIQLAKALGAEVMPILTLPSFQLDIPEIEASITNKTKAIVINTPNNPTGAVYPESDLRKIAEIADRHGLYVISDEIYEHFIYEGSHFSIGSIYPDTITMHGFSKEYSMTGWRLGYITGPIDVIDAINELQQYAVMSSSSIAQHAALEAIKSVHDVVDKYQKKRDLVVKNLEECGLKITGAQGSYFVFFQAPNDMTDLEFAELCLRHNLIVVPGRAFSSRHGFIRLSYGAPFHVVEKGTKVITDIINMLK